MNHIPVICDRCRAEGLAAEDPFEAFGALLDFEPVPRRTSRADGWDAETQRAFIAALSLSGSARQAARAVGKAAFGVKQLLDNELSEGFRAAHDEALAMAADERSRRLAEGLRTVAAERSGRRVQPGPWSRAASRAPAPAPKSRNGKKRWEDMTVEEQDAAAHRADASIFRRLVMKVRQEREARIGGRIVEADFYLRQITWIEVALHMATDDAWAFMRDFRIGAHTLLEMAESDFSRQLDDARRAFWESCGDPPRPPHTPRELLVDQGGFSIQPPESLRGGTDPSPKQQEQAYAERHKQAAEAQVIWEAAARQDYEERRKSSPGFPGEGDHAQHGGGADASSMSRDAACRPACEVRSTESKAEDAQQRSDLVERCEAAAGVPTASEDTFDDRSGEMMPHIISGHAGGMTGPIDDSLRDSPSSFSPPSTTPKEPDHAPR